MTSCRLQSNYSSTVTLHGGPVVLRPVRATPRLSYSCWRMNAIDIRLAYFCTKLITAKTSITVALIARL